MLRNVIVKGRPCVQTEPLEVGTANDVRNGHKVRKEG